MAAFLTRGNLVIDSAPLTAAEGEASAEEGTTVAPAGEAVAVEAPAREHRSTGVPTEEGEPPAVE